MSTAEKFKRSTPRQRQRNRRLLVVLLFLIGAGSLVAPYAVRHGWIYPQEATYAWPHFLDK